MVKLNTGQKVGVKGPCFKNVLIHQKNKFLLHTKVLICTAANIILWKGSTTHTC